MKRIDNHEMQLELENCRDLIEKRLSGCFVPNNESHATLLESMRYSLLAGGKRVRAVICVKFCEAAGGKPEAALDAACAIEMLHAYSLIHDDLPCMDDSGMRRGKLSNHVKYGDSTAVLAGDALQAAAFETLLGSDLPPGAVLEMAGILAKAAGQGGICGGQYLDLLGGQSNLTPHELTNIHNMKTASLISASARMGVVAALGTPEQVAAADEYALAVGLAFQARDDVLDVTSSTDKLGKPVGSDASGSKATFASLLGLSACEDIIVMETEKALAALKGKFDDPGFLAYLALMLADRES